MGRATEVVLEFVDTIPQVLPAEGTIYISIPKRATAHLCMCGCGEKVLHPLRPNRWSLTYDGQTVSMCPSIGNSGLACRSHYWIKKNRVEWLPPLTDAQIAYGMHRDGWSNPPDFAEVPAGEENVEESRRPWWRKLLGW
jgi:Family of unknown function (DUF6527)